MRNLIFVALVFAVASCSQPTPKQPQQYTIEQFYQNTRYSGGNFSNNESKLLVSSDLSGIFNVYEIDITDGTKRQVTFSEQESFFAIDYVPGTNQILYEADKDGNEISHIYLLTADSASVDLTPVEQEKASFGGWSDDKKSMYYLGGSNDLSK